MVVACLPLQMMYIVRHWGDCRGMWESPAPGGEPNLQSVPIASRVNALVSRNKEVADLCATMQIL
jgi:hypothetical protein